MIFVTNTALTQAVGVSDQAKTTIVSCRGNSEGSVSVDIRVDTVNILDFDTAATLVEAQALAAAIVIALS